MKQITPELVPIRAMLIKALVGQFKGTPTALNYGLIIKMADAALKVYTKQ